MISARAIQQGSLWSGIFRITRPNQDWTVSLPFQEEEQIDETYATRDEAVEAAFAFAETLLRSREKSKKR